MKKLVLISVMALVGLTASAQSKSHPSVTQRTKSKVEYRSQAQRSYHAVAPRTDLAMRCYANTSKGLTIDPAQLEPVTRAEKSVAALPVAQNKAFSKGMAQTRRNVIYQPTMALTSQAKAPRKVPEFAKTYIGVGVDYFTREDAQWTMTPSTATFTNPETSEEEQVDVFVDVIPTPSYLSSLYPDGIPVKYTVDEDDVITIEPQSVASYQNEAQDTTFYVTLFSANSDDEDGIINMEVGENGKLTITNGTWICFGEFANVEFDPDLSDSDTYLGLDELIVNINYHYQMETSIDEKYNAHGVNYFENVPVDWELQRGTNIIDGEKTHFFIGLTPTPESFASLYPNGIDVEYEKEDGSSTITVKPQVIASYTNEEGNREYILICSGTAEDGNIVLTEDKTGLLTIEDESVIIGAWSTNEFDPTFNTYLGAYLYIDNPKYRALDAPAEAPEDVAFEPEELVLFSGLALTGYGTNNNRAVMGAYAPTSFRNLTFDIATDFAWSVKEVGDDDAETTLTGTDRDFTINTKGGADYTDFSLIGYNEKEASESYTWGVGHYLNDGTPRYEVMRAYAGGGPVELIDEEGKSYDYTIMTRQNPDNELKFYINWATNDILEQYESSTRISTIYSYQGKPATPLYITGVTLPMVDFTANEDFNLHIKLCKCTRSATGTLTLGDVIAEGDATLENVNDQYASESGLTGVEFTDLYVEDEFGMSETVDYLFIEDEFVIVIEGWDNGTFSGVLGSQEYNFNEITSTWFQFPGEERLRSYSGGWPQLFIGLLDATYGYLYTEDDTTLTFDVEGGTSSIHVDPMLYNEDEETGEYSYSLEVEKVIVEGEEGEELPEWLSYEVANEDYTTATEVDEDGEEYEYFVNGIDYDLVFTAEALPEGVEYRTAQVVFMQRGALLTVTIKQGVDPDGIRTVVTTTPIKNHRTYNIAGQQVGKKYKGVVVKDGKKFLVK